MTGPVGLHVPRSRRRRTVKDERGGGGKGLARAQPPKGRASGPLPPPARSARSSDKTAAPGTCPLVRPELGSIKFNKVLGFESLAPRIQPFIESLCPDLNPLLKG